MKICLVFLSILLAVVYVASEWKPKTTDELKAISAECIAENSISPELVNKLRRLDFPDEEPVRKYVLCSAAKLDVFCSHEGYHADRLAKQFKLDLDEAEVHKIAQGCADKNEQGSPTDIWAYRGHQCLLASKVGDNLREYIKKKQQKNSEKSA